MIQVPPREDEVSLPMGGARTSQLSGLHRGFDFAANHGDRVKQTYFECILHENLNGIGFTRPASAVVELCGGFGVGKCFVCSPHVMWENGLEPPILLLSRVI